MVVLLDRLYILFERFFQRDVVAYFNIVMKCTYGVLLKQYLLSKHCSGACDRFLCVCKQNETV